MAIVQYERAYKQKGFMRLAHFLKPRVLDATKFDFPRNSALHWLKIDDKMVNVTKDYVYFKNLPEAYVRTEAEYAPEANYGKFMTKQINLDKVISENAKVCKQFDFLRPTSTKKKKELILSIWNYSGVNVKYTYMPQPMLRYYRFKNGYTTLFKQISITETDRHRFVIIDLPTKLLKRVEYEKYAKGLSTSTLDKFPTDESLMMLEFWKYIDPDLHKESVLSIIPLDKAKDINILFKYNNKYLWLTLYVIIRSIREFRQKYSIEEYKISTEELILPKVTPKGANDFKKIFYTMLEQFISLPAMTDDELAKQDKELEKENIDNFENAPATVKQSVPVIRQAVDTTTIQRPASLNDMITVLKEQNNVVSITKGGTEKVEENELDDSIFQEELKKANLAQDEDDVIDNANEEDVDEISSNDDTKDQLTLLDKLMSDNIDNEEEIVNNIEEILSQTTDYGNVLKAIDTLRKNRQITRAQMNSLKTAVEKQRKLKDPFRSKQDLKDVLDDSKDNLDVTEQETSITPIKTVFEATYNSNRTMKVRTDYIKNQYNKDLVRAVYNLQNSKFVIDKYEIQDKPDGLGSTQLHVISIKTLDNRVHTISIKMPVLKDDGTFMLNGMDYIMRFQRQDFPIKKVTPTAVKLSSYYNKYFIQKAIYKKSDVGEYILNCISKANVENNNFKDLILLPCKNEGVKLPQDYEHFARRIKNFTYKTYRFFFDYKKRGVLLKNATPELIKKIEAKRSVLVGTVGNSPIVMDEFSRLYVYSNNKYTEIPDLYELLGINRLQEPVEFAYLTMFGKKHIPIVYMLCYYYGLNQLFKVLKTEYSIHKPKERIKPDKPCYVVKFKDVKLVITRDYGLSDMILGGLLENSKLLITINSTSLNRREDTVAVLMKMGYNTIYVNEIKLCETLFVDPMTLSVLKKNKLPTSFNGLLIKSAELLLDDYVENKNKIDSCIIKGYERVVGIFYHELMMALKEYELGSIYAKKKIKMHPYAVINKIQEDSTTVLVDDLNPMAELKQTEDVSYLGEFGYSKDAVNMETRKATESEIGVISEGVKDNGDVGLTNYLSANPAITNIRGETKEVDNLDVANTMSTNALLMPFALADDGKRLNYSQIQSSHVIPINNMRAPYIRTGYESIVAVRSSEKFVVSAEADGVVTKVTPSQVEVKYKDKSKTYKIRNWTSKEESHACYTHIMKANVKVGDKVRKDDTLIYDSAFFEPDIFEPKRVIYKQGDMINVALMEDPTTHEDSAALSAKLNQRLGTTVTKVKSVVLETNMNVFNLVKVGQHVKPSDVLLSYTAGYLSKEKIDKSTLEILKNLQTASPKAKVEGVISKIIIRYNAELSDMSKTLKDIVNESDKKLKAETGFTGKVLDNNYRVEGNPLVPGQIEIKIYITTSEGMGIGDKGVFGNQLKFTVGDLYENEIVTEDGTPVEAKFSYRGISARIVNSLTIMGTASMVLEKLTDHVVKLYFGK